MPELQMNEPPNHFEWGKRKTPLEFSCGLLDVGFHPLGYEPEIISVFEHYAEAGDVAIDVGACLGFHTCLLSKLVGETGVVVAFEPQLVSFNYLMHHVHVANKLRNVLCIRQALWHENVAKLKLFNFKEMGYSSFMPYFEVSSFEHVEGRTLDSLLVEENDHPRILKIDCEGAEANVLFGAQRLLTKGIDCVILEFNYKLLEKTGRTDKPIRHFMHELGYDMFLINIGDTERQNELAAPIIVPIDKTIKLDGGFHINVLFSTEDKVRERWQ